MTGRFDLDDADGELLDVGQHDEPDGDGMTGHSPYDPRRTAVIDPTWRHTATGRLACEEPA